MMRLFSAILITVFFIFALNSDASAEISESIGYYTAGCVRNSAALPADGVGFRVIRLNRERFYGHPKLVEYVKRLGERVSADLRGELLVGDLSQKQGGPLPDDHTSHQSGLDADILFLQLPADKDLTSEAREELKPASLVSRNRRELDGWQAIHGEILKRAASDLEAERIFVNPVIKKRLCGDYPGEAWLQKIRPWWGHDGHFHVRLRCPEGSPLCEAQEPLASGDGCGEELNSWFKSDGTLRAKRERKSEPRPKRQSPRECLEILSKN